MAGKKGSRFVFVMVLLSSFFLLLSAFGVLPNPVRGAKRFQLDPDRTTGPAAAQPSESGNPQAPGDSQDETEETEILLMELPLYGNDPDSLPAGGNSLRVWPEELSVPILHEPDLKSYLGQTASPEPLRGITVILDASRGGADAGAVWGSGPDAVMEKTLVLDMALEAEKALAAADRRRFARGPRHQRGGRLPAGAAGDGRHPLCRAGRALLGCGHG